MSFSFEKETNGEMSFLVVEISRKIGKFVTTVYLKPTFSCFYTHLESFWRSRHKFGMLYTQYIDILLYAQIGQNFIENF